VKRIAFYLFMVGFSTAIFSQEKILLQDDFLNNKNGWKLQRDSNFLVDIRNGALHLEKTEKNFTHRGCLWYNKTVPGLNTLEDFSITIYARFISGGDIFEMIDLQWGIRDPASIDRRNDNLYQLSLLFRGEVKLDYFNYKWNYYIRKNVKNILNENGFKPGVLNKYELAQQDGFVIFRVNDKELLKQLSDPIPGNSIGFQQCLKSAWEIDRITVRQLNIPDSKTIVADTTATVQLDRDNATTGNGLKVYPNPFNNTLHINFELEKEETVHLSLIDINGAVLHEHSRKFTTGFQNM